MSENSKIEWTDHTFNPWIGCAKVSPGCTNCYAAAQDKFRSWTPEGWGKGKPRKRTSAANWKLPLRWNETAICSRCGRTHSLAQAAGNMGLCGWCELPHAEPRARLRRPRVFCASLADWLDDEVPIEWLADLLALIHATPNLDWQLLTKRPENWKPRLMAVIREQEDRPKPNFWPTYDALVNWLCGDSPAHVWIGTTVEDQQRADERIPELIDIPARVHFLSCEPLLGPVQIARFIGDENSGPTGIADWVICGGESGPGARPMHLEWVRSIRDQCEQAGVPFLFKQWGEYLPEEWIEVCLEAGDPISHFLKAPRLVVNGSAFRRVGKHNAGRGLDGQEWNQFPA